MREPQGGVRRGPGWRELVFWSAITTIVVLVVTAVVTETYLLLIPAVLLAIGAALTRRPGKAGPIMLAVVSVLFLLTNTPFLLPYLTVPASWINFILTTLVLITSVITLVAAVGALRRSRPPRSSAPRTLAFAGIALGAVCVVVAAVAATSYNPPSPRPGDLKLTAEDIAFQETRLNAQAREGSVSVFVDNQDTVLHTFTIDRLNVDLDVPANSTGRITFEAAPGSYRFLCTLHPDSMRGTLTVGG